MRALKERLTTLLRLFRARLSLRIIFWIFVSITVIEAILLVPSVQRRQAEMLDQIQDVTAAKVKWILMTYPQASGTELLQHVEALQQEAMLSPLIMGGAVYGPAGQVVGTFGESPQLPFADVRQRDSLYQRQTGGDRYDAVWVAAQPNGTYFIVIRHNADGVQVEMLAYILRITGLVLIIAAFVTVVMMLILGTNLITPILNLRRDLAIAGDAISNDCPAPPFASTRQLRRDELGEVIQTFQQMFDRICQAVDQRKRTEAELRANNEQMRQYLEQVNQVTAAANAVEEDCFLPADLATVRDRDDELGQLARVFCQMAAQVKEREAKLRLQVAELKVEIDQAKRQRDVAQITQSRYFQEMQEETRAIDLDEFWS